MHFLKTKQNKNKKTKQNQKPKYILCKLMERKIILLWVCICVVCLILSHSFADCSFSQLLFQECCIELPPTQWLNTSIFPYASVRWLGVWLGLDPVCGWAPSLLPCSLILWTVWLCKACSCHGLANIQAGLVRHVSSPCCALSGVSTLTKTNWLAELKVKGERNTFRSQ